MTEKNKLLPYLGLPVLITLYLFLKLKTDDAFTIMRSVLLIGFFYTAAIFDIKTRKIPNKLVLLMLSVWVVFMAVYVIIDIKAAATAIVQALVSCAAAGVFFLVIYLISRKGLGGGDVKLAAVMGLYLTLTRLMPVLFLTSVITALVSAVLLITKRATMKTAIPLVPFLCLGTYITILL